MPSRSERVSPAGTVTRRRVSASPPTATACAPQSAKRRYAEIAGRSFAHTLERGGMRQTWLRGRENVDKRYLIHVAGHNLGILMRHLIGAGTPKEAAARGRALLFVVCRENTLAIVIFTTADTAYAILIVAVTAMPT
ncbi:MAG TPA: hypothetical protein VLA17_15835 [Candidatus Limnocylindria bacterium]|nr:hypothetical protein [Candidatus Limnocylindria bacterium]